MHLYLVRHAIAVPRDAPGVLADEERPLTAKGAEKMKRHVGALKAIGLTVEEVWSSPLLRARQTAEILKEGLGLSPAIRIVPNLAPEGDLRALLDEVRQRVDCAGIALVGHEPDLGELAMLATSGTSGRGVRLKKGGVACVEIEDYTSPLRGELLWLLTPKQMSLMA